MSKPGITKHISKLMAMVDPASIAPPGVSGWAWEIMARAEPGTNDQAAIGVVFQMTDPTLHLYYRLIDESHWALARESYNDETMENLIWLTQLAREALDAKETTSPSPANLIYTDPYRINYPTPSIALERLWDNKINFFRARRDKAAVKGGDNPSVPPAMAESMIISQLRQRFESLASRIITPRRRASDVKGLLPALADATHVADITSASDDNPFDDDRQIIDLALDLHTIKTPEQQAALVILTQECTCMTREAAESYQAMLDKMRSKLAQMQVTPIEATTASEAADKIAQFFGDQ